jgi:hypothetical protein
MKITDQITNPVEIVNRFIISSFGKGWLGNCYLDSDKDFFPEKEDVLGIIGKPSNVETILKINRKGYYHPAYMKIAGQLGKQELQADGSVIVVFPDYKQQAIEYAELYEDFFKKPTNVIIASNLDYTYYEKNKEKFPFKKYSPSDKENELTRIEGLEQEIINSRAKNLGEIISSLTINENGILGFNGYLNEEQKREEYKKIIACFDILEKNKLIGKLSDDLPYLKLVEAKDPIAMRRYFERFNDSVESISDLELFKNLLLDSQ